MGGVRRDRVRSGDRVIAIYAPILTTVDFSCRLSNCRHIRDVLWPRGREFGVDEVSSGNESRLRPRCGVDYLFDTPFPCRIEVNARNVG
jgi:hypothetical protein